MDGLLPLWKQRGMTSHDCIFKLRKILHTKKIGHGGTLDPDVAGVLPICIGKGTKVIEYIQDHGKIYEGEMTLGFSTTTEDASGEVVAQVTLGQPVSTAEIDAAMKAMEGDITQIPPMYSAVKVNGRRLYDYARAGETVERPKRIAHIESFIRTSDPVFNAENGTQKWRFKVVCGKGTYVRTLAVDTGESLGFPAHMSELTRTASGGLNQRDALTLEQVAIAMEAGKIDQFLRPIEVAVEQFPRVDLTPELWSKVKNGMVLSYDEFKLNAVPDSLVAVFYNNQVVSLYQAHPSKPGFLKPSKVLRNE